MKIVYYEDKYFQYSVNLFDLVFILYIAFMMFLKKNLRKHKNPNKQGKTAEARKDICI